jgi:hypothetical protein
MPTRRALNGVLYGFLGTYMSRYSDYRGYWLFGFLIGGPNVLVFDLLCGVDQSDTPEAHAGYLARRKFAEQLEKSGFHRSSVGDASLRIERRLDTVERVVVGSVRRTGFDLRFSATVVADNGRSFHRAAEMFVAPHDASLEHPSAKVTHA